jgi:hypothetical protein
MTIHYVMSNKLKDKGDATLLFFIFEIKKDKGDATLLFFILISVKINLYQDKLRK